MRPEFSGQPSHPTESPWASLQTRGLTRGSAWRHKHATVVTVPGLPGPRPREVRVPAHDHVPGRRRVEEANLLIHTVTRRAPSWCPPCHGPSHTVPRWPARRERGQRALTGFCQSLGLCLRLLRPPCPRESRRRPWGGHCANREGGRGPARDGTQQELTQRPHPCLDVPSAARRPSRGHLRDTRGSRTLRPVVPGVQVRRAGTGFLKILRRQQGWGRPRRRASPQAGQALESDLGRVCLPCAYSQCLLQLTVAGGGPPGRHSDARALGRGRWGLRCAHAGTPNLGTGQQYCVPQSLRDKVGQSAGQLVPGRAATSLVQHTKARENAPIQVS